MSDLLDAAATLGLAAVLFVIGAAAGGDGGIIIGTGGALSAAYVGGRVGTLRQRVSELETQLDDAD